jgi:hypothetical protein
MSARAARRTGRSSCDVGGPDDAAAVAALDRRVVAATRGFAALHGVTPSDVAARRVEELVDVAAAAKGVWDRVGAGEIDFASIVGRVPDAARRPVVLHVAVARARDATPRALVVVAHEAS